MITLNKQNFDEVVTSSTKPIIVDVFATWCGPCVYMMPIVEELAKELEDKYTFVKMNVDESRELAIQYGVTSIPTFVFIKNNQVVNKAVGSMSKEVLKNKIEEVFK